jgi:hypothetical protein
MMDVWVLFAGVVVFAAFGTWLITEGIIRRDPFAVVLGWVMVAATFYLSGLFTAAL